MHFYGCALDILEEFSGEKEDEQAGWWYGRSVVVARRAFPGVAIRVPARYEIHLKKCLNQADFSAIIGLPNAHPVNLIFSLAFLYDI